MDGGHWADGGETKLANLVTLCRLHHRLVHEGEIRIETHPDGGWRFLHPDGRHFEVIRCTRTLPYDGEELEHTHAELGIHIDSDTAATRWRASAWTTILASGCCAIRPTAPASRPTSLARNTTFPRKRPKVRTDG
jgi:hypothetical protein